MQRRDFMLGSLAAAGALLLPGFRKPAQATTGKQLVFVFLRGGIDALGLVAPTRSEGERLLALRPNTAIRNGVSFGDELVLHRQLAPVLDNLYDQFNVVLHAGSVHETRSHFEQMDHVETGASIGSAETGFLGMAARALGRPSVGVGALMPASLRGTNPIVLSDPARVQAGYAHGGLKPGLTRAQRLGLYRKGPTESSDALVDALARQTEAQYDEIASALRGETLSDLVSQGRYVNSPFGQRLSVAAAMLATPSAPAIVTVDAEHGWDTHQNQATNDASGFYAYGKKVDDLAKNLVAFKNDLVARGRWNDTAIVLMSEFGRTVRENANLGTDHGRGGVMLLTGGAVRAHHDEAYTGRRSIELPAVIDESAALAVRHDYRAVMAELLERHLGLARADTLGLFSPAGGVSERDYLNVVPVP